MRTRRHLGICLTVVLLAAASSPVRADEPSNAIVELETSFGDILLELQAAEVSPVTVANFLWYVDSDFYDGLIFHRVIQGFMIQGGGFDPSLVKKEPNEPIINESYNGLVNLRGTLAMARTSEPNSATSEFYINHVDNSDLDPDPNAATVSQHAGYCVFGRVLDGMAVVDAIAATPTHPVGGQQDMPIDTVLIERARRVPVLVDVSLSDPNSDAILAHMSSEVLLSVRIENAGQAAFDPVAGETPSALTFLLGESGMGADDPNLEVVAELDLSTLAPNEVVLETVTFTAPAQRGGYVLYYGDNDPNVAGGFKLSDAMRQTAVAFSAEPNAPDLLIGEPESLEIHAWLDEMVAPPITVENAGGATAQAAAGFRMAWYMSTDPNFADDPNVSDDRNFPEHDPNAELVAQYSLLSLAAGASHVAAPGFAAPSTAGVYYLRSRADDGNDVLEYDESNNFGATVTLVVEPNAPDLIVLDPDQSSIFTWAEATVDFAVTVENIGGVDAKGEEEFTVELYMAGDANFSPDDPCTQVLSDASFTVEELAAGDSHTETISFQVPDRVGTYYVRAVVDDNNDVLEFDEMNNSGAAVMLTVDERIDTIAFSAKAGADPNTDSFSMSGQLSNIMLAEPIGPVTVNIEIGTYRETISLEGLDAVGRGWKYNYHGEKGGITVAVFDMTDGGFKIVAKDISLYGTTDPVPVIISIGDYHARGEVVDEMINRGKGIPFSFQFGLADMLRVDKFKHSSFSSGTNRSSLRVQGRISFADAAVALAGREVEVLYGSTFTFEDDSGLSQRGNGVIYAQQDKPASGKITKAVINLDKCSFSVNIRRQSFLNTPPAVIRLKLLDGADVIFNETAQVGEPQEDD